MTRSRISRRSLLAATGASSLLLPLLHQDRTFGADPAFPLRVIFCVTGNGTTEEAFWPTGTDGNLTLGEISKPLEAHKSKLIFTRGVDMRVWAEDNPFGGNGDAHHNWSAVLTATKLATGDAPHDPGGPGLALASSESIDIHLGKELDKQAIAAGNSGFPFPTLSVRARGGTGSGRNTLSWTGDRAPFSAEGDPRKLFDSLFSGYMGDKPDPVQVRLRKKRQSVLDYVGTALERQTKRLGTEDRQKVQLHLDAVRSIEKQLAGGVVTASCMPPTVETGVDFKLDDNLPKLVTAEHDLITAALACGLTRVATFAFADAENYDIYFPFLGIAHQGIEFPTRHHHDISHRPGDANVDKIKVENWIISQFSGLLDKLSAVPEGNGTLMDNTIVLWMNSLNSGFGHSVLKLPMIVAAGANTGLRTGGRLMELNKEAHNKVLAALGNAVGVPMQSWGDPRFPGVTTLT
jgi:Protein of unknown function (DUF1552)